MFIDLKRVMPICGFASFPNLHFFRLLATKVSSNLVANDADNADINLFTIVSLLTHNLPSFAQGMDMRAWCKNTTYRASNATSVVFPCKCPPSPPKTSGFKLSPRRMAVSSAHRTSGREAAIGQPRRAICIQSLRKLPGVAPQ